MTSSWRRRFRRLADRFCALIYRHRVHISGPLTYGGFRNVNCYWIEIEGHSGRATTDGGHSFLIPTLPFPPERMQWLRDICRNWWARGVSAETFTYLGPHRAPVKVVMAIPTWALPHIARLADNILRRDRPPQAGYLSESPYR